MQLLPETWEFVDLVLLGARTPRNYQGNVRAGVRYLRWQLDEFSGDRRLALAGWYQGARAVRERGLFDDTKEFVRIVLDAVRLGLTRLAAAADQLVQRPCSRIEHVPCLLGAGDRELGRVEKSDLSEERGLVPVDVLVGDLAVREPDDDAEREAHVPPRRCDARQQLGHLDVVREREDELVDDLALADRPGDRSDRDVGRPLADEVVAVELADTLERRPRPS